MFAQQTTPAALLLALALVRMSNATWVGERVDLERGILPPEIPRDFTLNFFDTVGDVKVVQVSFATRLLPDVSCQFRHSSCPAGLQWAAV